MSVGFQPVPSSATDAIEPDAVTLVSSRRFGSPAKYKHKNKEMS